MKLALHWQILIAILLGVVFGMFCHPYIGYISWLGTLFLRLLNMLVLPLIFSSVVAAIANLPGGETLRRIGCRTILFYATTTLLAILTGLVLVRIIQPGVGMNLSMKTGSIESLAANQKSFGELLMNMVPQNVFAALANGEALPVIFFAFLTGALIHSLSGKSQQTIKDFFQACFELMMNMTLCVVRLAPLGVFGLIAVQCAQYAGDSGRLVQAACSLGRFMATCFLGMGIHFFITMSIILLVFARVNPIRHIINMLPSLLTAFSTATSNATIPISMECLERDDGVSRTTSGFVIPLGATLNMNGTALYECVIVIFLSQAYGIPLSIGDQAMMVALVLLAAAGTAGIPMASFVMTAIALKAVGLPLEGLGVIMAIDRILDMTRTTVNIYGDTCCAVYIAKKEGEQLKI